MRAHIIVPEDLIHSVDKLVGPRSRSKFFVEAAGEKLAKLKLTRVAKRLAGSLANTTIPGWETRQKAVEWIRNSRKTDEEKLERSIHAK